MPNRTGWLAGLLLLALGACSDDEGAAAVLFEEGSARIAEGDYSGGVARLQRLLDEYPEARIAAVVRDDWAYYEELLRIESERLPGVAADDLRRIGAAIERYRSQRGRYPPNLEALVPRWIDSIAPDPWGRPYLYRRRGSGYEVGTRGRDGEAGGVAEDADIRVVDGRVRNAPAVPGRP